MEREKMTRIIEVDIVLQPGVDIPLFVMYCHDKSDRGHIPVVQFQRAGTNPRKERHQCRVADKDVENRQARQPEKYQQESGHRTSVLPTWAATSSCTSCSNREPISRVE